jgi:hypothetical protein
MVKSVQVTVATNSDPHSNRTGLHVFQIGFFVEVTEDVCEKLTHHNNIVYTFQFRSLLHIVRKRNRGRRSKHQRPMEVSSQYPQILDYIITPARNLICFGMRLQLIFQENYVCSNDFM